MPQHTRFKLINDINWLTEDRSCHTEREKKKNHAEKRTKNQENKIENSIRTKGEVSVSPLRFLSGNNIWIPEIYKNYQRTN